MESFWIFSSKNVLIMTQSGSSVKTVFSLWVHFKEMSQEYHHYTYWKKI